MSGMLSKKKLAFLFLSSILFTGCSSDDIASSAGSTINTASAVVSAENVEEIGKAAGEAVQVVTTSEQDLPAGIVINNDTSSSLTELDQLLIDAAHATLDTSNLPAGIVTDVTSGTCDSGTASMSFTSLPTGTGPLDITMTYNACTMIGSTLTVTGTFEMHDDDIANPDAPFWFKYTNFTITDSADGTTTTLDAFVDCPTGTLSCTYSVDYVGADGVSHRITDDNFYGDATIGFDGTATFYHGTHGGVTITVTGVTYGSCGAYPDGGMIEFSSDNGSSGTIIFASNCTVSGTWSDGTSTVSW